MNIDKKIVFSGKTWILLGFLFMLIGQTIFNKADLIKIAVDLIFQLGLAFVVMGVVAIILQFKDWKQYFQERLKEIVIQRSYLETLNTQELADLQIDTLKAKYKATDIDREGSFLHYIQEKVQDFIGLPYRENISCSVTIEEDKHDLQAFKVYDTLAYVCRSIGDNIQNEVRWLFEKDEFSSVESVELKIVCPIKRKEDCEKKCKNDGNCNDGVIKIDNPQMNQNYTYNKNNLNGYLVKLNEVLWPNDLMQIELKTCYKIKKGRIFTWAMANPSKGINFTINFPSAYILNRFIGGIDPKEYVDNFNGNMYTFKHEGWFLPRTGLAWNLMEKPNQKEIQGNQPNTALNPDC